MDKNKFFFVQFNVKQFKDAEFFATHEHTWNIGLYGVASFLFAALIFIFIGLAEKHNSLIIVGIVIAICCFAFTMISDFKPVQFILRLVARLLFGSKIDTKVSKIQKDAVAELYEFREAFPWMKNAGQEWRLVAEDAEAILQKNHYIV